MYKVFVKESSVTLTDQQAKEGEVFRNIHQLYEVFQNLEESPDTRHLVIFHHNLEELWKNWCELFEIIEAAGGIVVNEAGEILMIHRLEKWDLPKGKLEPNEEIAAGAVREVVEECAIPEPSIVRQLPDSYHTYRIGERPILKRTYWFEMVVNGSPEPSPQEEEDITEAVWCSGNELEPKLANSYPNIVNLIRYYQKND